MLRQFHCLHGHSWEAEADEGDEAIPHCPACGQVADIVSPFASATPPVLELIDDADPPARGANSFPHIPGYEIRERLPGGPLGVECYHARQSVADREVLLEVVVAKDDPGQKAWGALRGEARALGKLDHANIPKILNVGERDRLLFYNVRSDPKGPLLSDWLEGKPLVWREAVELVRVLALAVQHAHERGIVHRAIQPRFVRLAPAEGEGPGCVRLRGQWVRPLLERFGLTRGKLQENEPADLELQPTLPAYLAPEQAMGRPALIGPRTDIYALAVLLTELILGRSPLVGANRMETLDLVMDPKPALLEPLRAKVSADLYAVVQKAMHPRVRSRYDDAKDFAADLGRLGKGEAPQARPAGAIRQLASAMAHRPRLTFFGFGLLAGLVLMLVGAANGWFQGRPRVQVIPPRVESASELTWARPRAMRHTFSQARQALVDDNANRFREIMDVVPFSWRDEDWKLLSVLGRQIPTPILRDGRPIHCMALSDDGSLLALGLGSEQGVGNTHFLRTYLIGSVFIPQTEKQYHSGDRPIRSIVFTDTGEFYALAVRDGNDDEAEILRGSLQDRMPQRIHRTRKNGAQALAYLREGQLLLLLDRDSVYKYPHNPDLVNLVNESTLHSLRASKDRRSLTAINGTPFAGSTGYQGVVVLEPNGEARIIQVPQQRSQTFHLMPTEGLLCQHADAQFLVAGHSKGTISLWRVDERTNSLHPQQTFRDTESEVLAVRLDVDAKRIYSLSKDRTFRAWSMDDGSLIFAVPLPALVTGEPLAMARGGNILAIAFPKQVFVWNLNSR